MLLIEMMLGFAGRFYSMDGSLPKRVREEDSDIDVCSMVMPEIENADRVLRKRMLFAAAHGKKRVVQAILNSGMDVNLRSRLSQRTPLEFVAEHGNTC